MRADAAPEIPVGVPPREDVRPRPGEVLYVPGPVEPGPERSAWQQFRKRLRETEARAVPRSAMNDVALAKQELLDLAYAPPSRRNLSLLRVKPLQAAIGGAVLLGVITYIPITRTALKVGMIFALRSVIARLVTRYMP